VAEETSWLSGACAIPAGTKVSAWRVRAGGEVADVDRQPSAMVRAPNTRSSPLRPTMTPAARPAESRPGDLRIAANSHRSPSISALLIK
jgi:hypothetical protein